MPDPPFDVGDLARVRLALTDHETGSPISPTSVALHTRTPTGTLASYHSAGASIPTAVASGVFQVDVPITVAGVWDYRWVATGPMAAEAGKIPVASTIF